jgi:hypothetical protein
VLGHCPVGIRRALARLPVKALQQQNYQRLVLLLADRDSAKVLHHAANIDDLAIAVLLICHSRCADPCRSPCRIGRGN